MGSGIASGGPGWLASCKREIAQRVREVEQSMTSGAGCRCGGSSPGRADPALRRDPRGGDGRCARALPSRRPAGADCPGAGGLEVYQTLRAGAIAAIMSSLIAILAVQYRSAYEAKLQARNEELEATRDFLSRIIEGSAEAIITRDTAGRVTSWNPAAEAIYGWSASEMLGRTIECLVPDDPEARAELARHEAALERGETVRGLETQRVRKGGKPIAVALTMSPLYDRTGLPAGSTGIVRDVTSLKEMEARLVERERLAAVGEVAAMVAHEVRNPSPAFAAVARSSSRATHPGTRSEIGQVIHQVDRLNRIVHELLLFSAQAMDPVPTGLHAPRPAALRPRRGSGVPLRRGAARLRQRPARGRGRRPADRAGVPQLVAQRMPGRRGEGSGRPADRRERAVGRGDDPGHGARDPGREDGADLQAVLHYESPGHGTRARNLQEDRGGAPRPDRRLVAAGRGGPVHRGPPGGRRRGADGAEAAGF